MPSLFNRPRIKTAAKHPTPKCTKLPLQLDRHNNTATSSNSPQNQLVGSTAERRQPWPSPYPPCLYTPETELHSGLQDLFQPGN